MSARACGTPIIVGRLTVVKPSGKLHRVSGETGGAQGRRHVFVVVEGAAARHLDWKSLRQEVVAARGYVSLALVNGARANWIVRPTPSTGQIPTQVSTSGAGVARPGIAASLTDQVLEAQALVPRIQFTEVRVYGGTLLETELHDVLKGDQSIQLRVFDTAGFRPGRSTPSLPITPRPPAVTVKGSPASSPSLSALPSHPATATPSASVAPARRPPQSLNRRFQPARRLVAALLSAAAVGVGVFPGYVWTHIWGYSYPGDAPLVARLVSQTQSSAFGVSLLIGTLIAILGTRARWSALLGFAYGIAAGITPAALPRPLAWPAPAWLATILSNIAGFWGTWLAWAPALYIAAGTALSIAVKNTLPPTRIEVIKARARNRARVKDFLGRRSPVDHWTITLLLWSSLTGILPWLLGRFVWEGVIFKPGPGVFDTDAREFWAYVPPLYLGGLAGLLILSSLMMILQPWPGRNGLGFMGILLLVSGVVVASWGSSLWASAETETAQRLTSTAFPFGDQFLTCGHAQASLTDAAGNTSLWQVWSAQIQNSSVGIGQCNRLVVYQGWQRVRQYDLPAGVTITRGPDFVSGSTPSNAIFRYVKSDGLTVQMRVNDG